MRASVYCGACATTSLLDPGLDGKAPCPKCGGLLDAPAVCDVFISYASADLARAQEVAGLLGAEGINYWIAPDRIGVGDSFLVEISEALSVAKVVVLIFSSKAAQSRWVLNEITDANNRNCAILPLKIEDFEIPRHWQFLLSNHQWKEAFEESFLTRSERLIESVKTKLLRIAARTTAQPEAAPAPQPVELADLQGVDPSHSPYVGPQPFRPRMANRFFGRQHEAEALLAEISASRVLLVYAPSGAGKTSLLNTLITQNLEAQGYDVMLDARVGGALPSNLKELEIRNIYTFSAIYGLERGVKPNPQWTLKDYLRSIDCKPGTRSRVLVFDQFEELFTQHQHLFPHRGGFFEDVIEALEADPALRVIFAMRQEYLADIDPLAAMLPTELKMQRFALRRLGPDGALEAIVKPAAPFAVFAPGVAETIVNQLNTIRVVGFDGEPVTTRGEFIEMVHLQIVCDRLWSSLPPGITTIETEHLSRAAGEGKDLGDFVVNALDAFYDDTIEKVARSTGFSEDLIRLGCMKFVTTASTRTMVQRSKGRTGRLPDKIVEQLENSHLLRVEERGGQRWYELSHDSLAGPVGRKMDRQMSSLLFAADLLNKVLENALQSNANSLQGYFEEHRDVLAECRPFHAQTGLFLDEAEFVFRASLTAGQDMREWSKRLAEDYPEARVGVLRDALSSPSAAVRRNAAALLGREPAVELMEGLVSLAIGDPDASVRRTAGVSLARLDRPEIHDGLVDALDDPARSAGALEALSRIKVAADSFLVADSFESRFERMSRSLRGRIRQRSWALRLVERLPALAFVCIPAASLAAVAAASFKWLPGLANWAVCQAQASAAMGIFHGLIAGVVWAGSIALGVTFYHVVFGREHRPKSAVRPFAAIIVGALSGFVSSLLVVLIIINVYTDSALVLMGWVPELPGNPVRSNMDLWLDVFVRFRYGWVYPILGTGLGVGMALVINALRASSHWKDFLERQDGHLTGFRETAEVTRKIMKLALPYAWFLPLAIGLAAVFAFLTPDTVPVTNAAAPIKASREDLILGIAADGLTQAIGAYFGICGMGLGMVVMRRGLHVQSRNDLT